MLTVDERKYIKMYLPYGTQVKIAKEVGTSPYLFGNLDLCPVWEIHLNVLAFIYC